MDELSRAKLLEIQNKDLSAVTDADREFLRARIGYLSSDDKKKFSLLKAPTPKEGDEPKKKTE